MLDTYTAKNYLPDIELAGLRIWIDSRKYPNHYDFCDGNWLNTTVHCSSESSAVWFSGDMLRSDDIVEWLNSLEKLNEAITNDENFNMTSVLGEANLNPTEQHFTIKIKPRTYQRVSIEIHIFPNYFSEKHYYEFWLDQGCLNHLIENCRNILTKFPSEENAGINITLIFFKNARL